MIDIKREGTLGGNEEAAGCVHQQTFHLDASGRSQLVPKCPLASSACSATHASADDSQTNLIDGRSCFYCRFCASPLRTHQPTVEPNRTDPACRRQELLLPPSARMDTGYWYVFSHVFSHRVTRYWYRTLAESATVFASLGKTVLEKNLCHLLKIQHFCAKHKAML